MAEMKGIKVCGECANYDWKKHKCRIGCLDDSDAQARFYSDCPLPDVVPKSEVDKLKIEIEALKIANEKMYEAFGRQAREIFEEIDELVFQHGRGDLADKYFYAEVEKLKEKYLEG